MRELARHLKIEKKHWLGPIVIVLVLFALLFAFAEASALAPFIYSLF